MCKDMIHILNSKEEEIKKIIDELSKTEIMEKNPAVVYDIDYTLLDGKGYGIKQILRTFDYAKKKGFSPFLVTARQGYESVITSTLLQLISVGIRDHLIYFLPQGYGDIKKYKKMARKDINKTHTVGLSIGDSSWDYGEYGGIGVHIPWDNCDCESIVENSIF